MRKPGFALALIILAFTGLALGQIPNPPGTSTKGSKKRPDNQALSMAPSPCRKVRFEYTNETGYQMYVFKVKYFSSLGSKWYEERFGKNVTCAPGQTCQTRNGRDGGNNPSQLPDQAGEQITRIIFYYKIASRQLYPPSGFSPMLESTTFDPNEASCYDGKIYGNRQKWTIVKTREIEQLEAGKEIPGVKSSTSIPMNGSGDQKRGRVKRKKP